MKFGPCQGVFHIQAVQKMGREKKGGRRGVGPSYQTNFFEGHDQLIAVQNLESSERIQMYVWDLLLGFHFQRKILGGI